MAGSVEGGSAFLLVKRVLAAFREQETCGDICSHFGWVDDVRVEG